MSADRRASGRSSKPLISETSAADLGEALVTDYVRQYECFGVSLLAHSGVEELDAVRSATCIQRGNLWRRASDR